MVETAGGRDHEFFRAVVPAVVLQDGLPGDRLDGLRRPADRAAERMGPEDFLHELLVGNVGGIIAVHGDFFQDDVPFLLQLLRVNHGGGDHVRNDVDRHGQVGVQNPGVIAGVLLRRRRVGLSADLVKGRRDIERAPTLRSLEEQVLEEVRGPVLAVRLVP